MFPTVSIAVPLFWLAQSMARILYIICIWLTRKKKYNGDCREGLGLIGFRV